MPAPEQQLLVVKDWISGQPALSQAVNGAKRLTAAVLGYPSWHLLLLATDCQKSLASLTTWYSRGENAREPTYGVGFKSRFFVGLFSAVEFGRNRIPGFPFEDAWEKLLSEELLFSTQQGFSHLPNQPVTDAESSLRVAVEVEPSRPELPIPYDTLDLVNGRLSFTGIKATSSRIEEPEWQDDDGYLIRIRGDSQALDEDDWWDAGHRGKVISRLHQENRLPYIDSARGLASLGPRLAYSGEERIDYLAGHWIPTPHQQVSLASRLTGECVSEVEVQELVARIMGYSDWATMVTRRYVPTVPFDQPFQFVWPSRIVQTLRWDVTPSAAVETLRYHYFARREVDILFWDESLVRTLDNMQEWGGPLQGVLHWDEHGHHQEAKVRLFFGRHHNAGLRIPADCTADTVEFVPDGTHCRVTLERTGGDYLAKDGGAVLDVVEYLVDAGLYHYAAPQFLEEPDNPF